MYKKHETGIIGENMAERYLRNIGYEIIQRNFYCKQGEIDIIAKDKNELVFIEVKTRTNITYGKPAESVNNIKQKHIYDATKYYLYKNSINEVYVRFDVIEIYLLNRKAKINHIKQIL